MMKVLSIGGVRAGSGLRIYSGDALLKGPLGEGIPGQGHGWDLYQDVLPGRPLGCRAWLASDPFSLFLFQPAVPSRQGSADSLP